MKNYGRMHRAETMYAIIYPYRDALKQDCPKKNSAHPYGESLDKPMARLAGTIEGNPVQQKAKIKEHEWTNLNA